MFDVLKETLNSVQGSLSTSFRGLSTKEEVSSRAIGKYPFLEKLNLNNGVEILEKYQSDWNELHKQATENSKQAEIVDNQIGRLHLRIEAQWRNMSQVGTALTRLPEVTYEVNELSQRLGTLSELFVEVEKSLANLGDLIERRELQEKQLDHRFQLALYKEKKLSQLESTRVNLAQDHARKVAQHDARQHRIKKERQEAFEQQFKQDVDIYIETKELPKITRHGGEPSETKLEEVELDNPEDKSELDRFLHEDTPEPKSDG